MKSIVIGFFGKARSGKDTAAAFIGKAVGRKDLPVTSIHTLAFADPLREMLRIGFGLEEQHFSGEMKESPLPEWNNVSPRKLMQELGTGFGRKMDPEVWVKNMRMRIAEKTAQLSPSDQHPLFIVTDVRMNNEADLIHELGGSVIEIIRDTGEGIQVRAHTSENGIAPEKVDQQIHNNGSLSAYKNKVMTAVQKAIS